jgi:hypothetical protein
MERKMALDHGMLNLPLAKRGNIDSQIDAYKAQKAAEARIAHKTASKLHEEQRVAAKAILASKDEAFFVRMGLRLRITPKQAAKKLNSMAHWEPAQILKLATTTTTVRATESAS